MGVFQNKTFLIKTISNIIKMNFKYLIPFIGWYFISKDIPHFEHERSYKPLQGNDALVTMFVSAWSTILAVVLIFS